MKTECIRNVCGNDSEERKKKKREKERMGKRKEGALFSDIVAVQTMTKNPRQKVTMTMKMPLLVLRGQWTMLTLSRMLWTLC